MAKQKHFILLGGALLPQPDDARIKVSDKLSDIPTFEAEIFNNSANRTALENITQDVTIKSFNLAASDDIQKYDDTEVSNPLDVYVKVSTLTFTKPDHGTIRVKFDLRRQGGTAYGRVYKNGIAIGIERSTTSTTYITFSEDIAVIINTGDTIELWTRNANLLNFTYSKNFRIYYTNQTIFSGRIEGEDGIEYLSRRRIRISGYNKMIELAHAFFLRLSTSGTLTPTSIQADDGGIFTNKTIEGTNATINDVTIPITGLNDAIYIGYSKPFNVAKLKYSTAGVYNATVVWEYWNGTSWTALTCLDETKGFTKAASTRYLIIPNKPADWATTSVNGSSAYYIRMQVSAFTSATTQPLGDQIWVGNEDIARIQYDNIAANTILQDVLDHANIQYGSSYTISECPTTPISLRGEYDSHLKWISEIAAALTWTDANSDKHEYDWWVDSSNGIHIKLRRENYVEASPYDLSSKLQVLNRKEKYKIGNRIFGLGYGDGINQLRNIREHTGSQATYGLRDAMFSDLRILHTATLNEKGDTILGKCRAPANTYDCNVRFEDFLDAGLAVGDWIKINQPEWNATNVIVRLRAYDLNTKDVRLEVSNEMESVSSLIQSLQRNVDVLNKSMQGATNIYQAGPLLDNFERIDATTFFPLTLKIYVPAQAKIINKVLLNWTLSQFRGASKTAQSGGGSVQTSGNQSATHTHSTNLYNYDIAKDTYLLGMTDNVNFRKNSGFAPTTFGSNSNSADHTHNVTIPAHTHNNDYGIQEDTDTSPVMELKIGSTVVGSTYSGDQQDIDITPYVIIGWNTVQLYPATGQNKRGRAQLDSVIQVFIESR